MVVAAVVGEAVAAAVKVADMEGCIVVVVVAAVVLCWGGGIEC